MAYSVNDKRNGAIIGHALGDALGAPVEFYPYAHYTGVLNTPIVRYSRAYGKQIGSIGLTTDDTEMALVLLETLKSGYSKEKHRSTCSSHVIRTKNKRRCRNI